MQTKPVKIKLMKQDDFTKYMLAVLSRASFQGYTITATTDNFRVSNSINTFKISPHNSLCSELALKELDKALDDSLHLEHIKTIRNQALSKLSSEEMRALGM